MTYLSDRFARSSIATAYLDSFNAIDPAQRKVLVAKTFAADVSYVDPLAEISGQDQLAAFIAGAQEKISRLDLLARRRCRRPPQPGPLQLGPRS